MTVFTEVIFNEWQGYTVHATDQVITVLISTLQCCCESWGIDVYDPHGHRVDIQSSSDGTGAAAPDAEVTEVGWGSELTEYDVRFDRSRGRVVTYNAGHTYQPNQAVVDITTTKGVYKIIAWNDHCGAYPHDVKVEWKGYSDTQRI